MIAGELFFKLGILGDNKAKQQLSGIKGTLGEVKTTGLAAKAAILGMVYGLERLMTNSMNAGASLMSYANATGLSAERLQQWQYAARHAGVSADEMEQSMVGLQSAMMRMQIHGEVPEGMGVIAAATHVDMSRVRDTDYMMKKVMEYVNTEKNVDFANEMAKSMGLSMNMIAGGRQGMFDEKKMQQAPLYSNAEAAKLQQVKNAWGDLGQNFEMMIGHLNAKHGLKIVKDLSGVSKELIKMVNSFAKLIEQTKALSALGTVFKGWGEIFGLIALGADKLKELSGGDQKKGGNLSKWWGDLTSGKVGERLAEMSDFTESNDIQDVMYKRAPTSTLANPKPPPMHGKGGPQTTTHSPKITNHFHGVHGPKQAAKQFAKDVDRTYRNIPTNGVAN